MKLTQKIIGVAAGALIIAGSGAALTTSASAATPVTAVTHLTQRPDSGYSGNWALDNLTRTVTITGGTATTPALCGAAATACFAYTGTISDTGKAFATTGAVSPGKEAAPVKGSPTAAVTGEATFALDASSDAPDATLVPASLAGAGSTEQSTTNWAEQFFPAGTTFGAGPSLPSWSWTYTDAKDCQQWVDALNGTQAASGDITGVDSCLTTVAPVGNQSVTVGQPASIPVFGSTSSSDKSLAYTATGLPDGLAIDAATGVVSGTPKADAASGTVNVTVTDFGGIAAGTSFGVTVKPAGTVPAPQVALSHGKGIPVAGTRENVSWSQSGPSWEKLTIAGPGAINGHVGYVHVTGSSGLGAYSGLLPGHTYTVTVQPEVTRNGASAGNSGKVVFVTTH